MGRVHLWQNRINFSFLDTKILSIIVRNLDKSLIENLYKEVMSKLYKKESYLVFNVLTIYIMENKFKRESYFVEKNLSQFFSNNLIIKNHPKLEVIRSIFTL